MSAEETLRALLSGTVDVVRRSLRDSTAEALVEDYSDALRKVLRQAYEVGYREGLASAGRPSDAGAPLRDEVLPIAVAGESTPATAEGDDLEPETENGASGPDSPPIEADDLEHDEPQTSPDASAEPAPAPLDWDGEEATAVVVERRRESPRDTGSLRIFPHATVGTLLQRIYDYFGLERFDIEVIICRKGDRDRRQLKKSVRLAKYEVVE
jgi:hypothetical protein